MSPLELSWWTRTSLTQFNPGIESVGWRIVQPDCPLPMSGIGKAEKAYHFLGYWAGCKDCFGDDGVRRRRFGALLRAEMRRRERMRETTPDVMYLQPVH